MVEVVLNSLPSELEAYVPGDYEDQLPEGHGEPSLEEQRWRGDFEGEDCYGIQDEGPDDEDY